MKIVTNEIEVVREIFEDNVFSHGYGITMLCLAKHYKGIGMSKDESLKSIVNLFEERDVVFEKQHLKKMLRDIVDSVFNNDRNLINVESVSITVDEWCAIKSIGDESLERLLFVLLVYVKTNMVVKEKENLWFNGSELELFKEAKVNSRFLKKADRCMAIYNLTKTGLIEMAKSYRRMAFKVNFVNNDSDTLFEVDDFENIIYFYRKYSGEPIKKCSNCKKIYKINKKNANSRSKYCSETCRDASRKRQNREKTKRWKEKNI